MSFRRHGLLAYIDTISRLYFFFLSFSFSFSVGLFQLGMFLGFRCTATREGTFFT